jgi:hypothetical protein
MQNTIHIPSPCNEQWDDMAPDGNGRHCAVCCKTVTDFTHWATADILDYIRQGRGNVCGRFRKSQLVNDDDPVVLASNIGQASIPLWSKIAAIILVVLGMQLTSCSSDENYTTGEPAMQRDSTVQVVQNDTVKTASIKPVQVTTKQRKHLEEETVPVGAVPEPMIMGIPEDAEPEPQHDTVLNK